VDKNIVDKTYIIDACEYQCRKNNKKLLSPGVMSNFPDRFDGFHTYNRCCRSSQDTGRSKENLKSYTKDRRAYELWSDGNIHAANQFMGSSFFFGKSADHVGAISLGFVHDPRYLRPMTSNDNSAKRDRLTVGDVAKILEIESCTNVYPMTWYSREIWEYIKRNYKSNLDKVGKEYRSALKQNFTNYMFILKSIIENNGNEFLTELLLKPHYEDFMFDYTFNELSEIVDKSERRFTERSKYEFDRYVRIAFQSVVEYHEKENRNFAHNLNISELDILRNITTTIAKNQFKDAFLSLNKLMMEIQNRLIENIK
jgi:Alw26I/Eco31I/Esp3I family type II restriction endonuclease